MTAWVAVAFAAPVMAADDGAPSDPLEPVNRVIFSFNEGLDVVFLEPLTKLYRFVLPDYVLDRIEHAFVNIREPLSTVNYVLQGDFDNAGDSLLRFAVNSTVGVAGLWDVIGDQSEDKLTGFGDTFGSWGVGPGPYLVLPLLGPSDFRDAAGLAADYYADPVRIALHSGEADIDHPETIYTGVQLAEGFDARSRLLKQIDDLRRNSLDFYAAVRSIYLQRRAAKVSGKSDADANVDAAPDIPNYKD
jgi:phospholipid-binding lipoprotein MlaA